MNLRISHKHERDRAIAYLWAYLMSTNVFFVYNNLGHRNLNYETFQNGLTEKLKASQTPTINLDDDLRNLANNIVDRFPQINVSRDQLYNHFMSKKEQIVEMINQHNKDIVEALIKITPQLAKDLESQTITNENAQTGNADANRDPLAGFDVGDIA